LHTGYEINPNFAEWRKPLATVCKAKTEQAVIKNSNQVKNCKSLFILSGLGAIY
jgi:hypothetical protein